MIFNKSLFVSFVFVFPSFLSISPLSSSTYCLSLSHHSYSYDTAYSAMMCEYQRRQLLSQFFYQKNQVFPANWKEEINMDDMSHFITSSPNNAKQFNNNNNNDGGDLGVMGSGGGGINNRRTRSEDARWECPQCGKRYKYSRGLAMHRRLECGKEPMFHCPYCPQKCHQKGNMVIHIKKKHPEKANPLQ
uniref:Longitudinals lacking protein, isoforms F/I/K/T n=2 Tax=Cacopsylla melanoneura TaxID=428564 RepID=A0A8D8Z025_9HEMI